MPSTKSRRYWLWRISGAPSGTSYRTAPGPSVFDRLPDPLRDHCRVLREVKRHGAVETLRPGDHHPYAAAEGIRGNPGFVGLGQTAAGGHHCRLDPCAPGGWDSFAVEYSQRHLKTVAGATRGRPAESIVADDASGNGPYRALRVH